jgi:hypothetical protein
MIDPISPLFDEGEKKLKFMTAHKREIVVVSNSRGITHSIINFPDIHIQTEHTP